MTAIPLLNDDEPDIKLNNPPSSLYDTYTFIVIYLLFSLSPESNSIITDSSALDDKTLDLINALSMSPFVESSLFNHNYLLTLLLLASALNNAPDSGTGQLLIPDKILTLLFILSSSTIGEWYIFFSSASQIKR